MKHYYFAENDRQFGPFTIEELKSKRLKKCTLVWTDGMEDWDTADRLEELKDIIISEPPPLPKRENIPPKVETVQIKPVKLVTPIPVFSSKYALDYEKETDATAVGVFLIVITIIFNLVDNAIRFRAYTDYEKASIKTVMVEAKMEKEDYVITISNPGLIPDGIMDFINKDKPEKSIRSTDGLAISKQLTSKYGWKLLCQKSQNDYITVFTIKIR